MSRLTHRSIGLRGLAATWLGLGCMLAMMLGCGRGEPTAPAGASSGARSSSTGPSPEASPSAPARPASSASPASSDTRSAATAAAATTGPSSALSGEWPPAVVDLHVDTPWQVHTKGRAASLPEGHITADKLRQGRYAGIVLALFAPDHAHDHPKPADLDGLVATVDSIVAANDLLRLAPPSGGPAGLPAALAEGKVAVFVAIEGAEALAGDLSQVDRFIARGVRLVGPVHARDNSLSASSGGSGRGGLSPLGKQLCQRVYARGALCDVSHMSDAAFWDLVPLAKAAGAPLVASHSNARAVCDNPRNLTDEQLRAIAESGGVAGLNLHGKFVRRSKPRLAHAVEQVLHMVRVAGIDHVAIGTDFDGGQPVHDLEDASRLPALADALRASGLAEDDVRKVFHRNALRILGWQKRPGG
jgi:membrane dipeptidase